MQLKDPRFYQIRESIYSHLSGVYPKKESSLFGAFVSGITYILYLVRIFAIDPFRDQIYVRTAGGSVKVGTRGKIGINGIRVLYIDDQWPSDEYEIPFMYDAAARAIKLGEYPLFFLTEDDQEYNLTNNENKIFWVYIEPDKLPNISFKKDLILTPKKTPDFLNEICRNRSIYRRSGEADAGLKARARSLGIHNIERHVRKQLEWILQEIPYNLVKFRESWESWTIPGISFVGYSPKVQVIPPGTISELFYGSFYCEKSYNIFTFEVFLDIGAKIDDDYIIREINKIIAGGINFRVIRVLSRPDEPGPIHYFEQDEPIVEQEIIESPIVEQQEVIFEDQLITEL